MGQFELGDRIIPLRQVVELTNLSKTTIWRLGKRRLFPRSFRLSPGRVGFSERAVVAWLSAIAQAEQPDE